MAGLFERKIMQQYYEIEMMVGDSYLIDMSRENVQTVVQKAPVVTNVTSVVSLTKRMN